MPLGVPAVRGVIDRRILLNYRIRPDAMAAALPDAFEPLTVDGWAVGGICLIRLRDLRPRGLPAAVGVGSENAAHRIAVSWERDGERRETTTAGGGTREESTVGGTSPREEVTAGASTSEETTVARSGTREEGVYVPRRDTSSLLFAAAGGRLFSDRHHRAAFQVREGDGRYEVTMDSRDGSTRVHVAARETDDLPEDSVFDSLDAASTFFERGSTGLSASGDREDYYAVELRTREWAVEPLAVESASSSYFEDAVEHGSTSSRSQARGNEGRFPSDAVELDHALLMRDVDHEWHEKEPLCA